MDDAVHSLRVVLNKTVNSVTTYLSGFIQRTGKIQGQKILTLLVVFAFLFSTFPVSLIAADDSTYLPESDFIDFDDYDYLLYSSDEQNDGSHIDPAGAGGISREEFDLMGLSNSGSSGMGSSFLDPFGSFIGFTPANGNPFDVTPILVSIIIKDSSGIVVHPVPNQEPLISGKTYTAEMNFTETTTGMNMAANTDYTYQMPDNVSFAGMTGGFISSATDMEAISFTISSTGLITIRLTQGYRDAYPIASFILGIPIVFSGEYVDLPFHSGDIRIDLTTIPLVVLKEENYDKANNTITYITTTTIMDHGVNLGDIKIVDRPFSTTSSLDQYPSTTRTNIGSYLIEDGFIVTYQINDGPKQSPMVAWSTGNADFILTFPSAPLNRSDKLTIEYTVDIGKLVDRNEPHPTHYWASLESMRMNYEIFLYNHVYAYINNTTVGE